MRRVAISAVLVAVFTPVAQGAVHHASRRNRTRHHGSRVLRVGTYKDSAGNEIWFNGGDGSGKIDMNGFRGAYLNATSSFYKDDATAAGYGIFSSNASGGTWSQTYASNMADSDYYIGACAQACDTTVD